MTITAKINVSKVDKSKLYHGEKGVYLDLVLVETPDSPYGDDYMVVQGVSKDDRLAGVKGAILGNAKIRGEGKRPATPAPNAPAPAPQENLDDDSVPF